MALPSSKQPTQEKSKACRQARFQSTLAAFSPQRFYIDFMPRQAVKRKANPRQKKPYQPAKRRFKKQRRGSGSSLKIIEFICLSTTAALVTIVVLGFSARHFSGTDMLSNLLPFTAGIVGLVITAAVSCLFWYRLRNHLRRYSVLLPALTATGLLIISGWISIHNDYLPVFAHFKTLVAGKQLVQSENLAHQVYAAYRRQDQKLLLQMIERAQSYQQPIEEDAHGFDLEPSLLYGLAATESSFLPRDSYDGGHGLFQITAIPQAIQQKARQKLGVSKLSLNDSRHNAFLAAATLKFYLTEMRNDLYLGLLAYNIGPRNGGLRFIMDQYGATDFVSMQPYLQTLPRDYPIRVLSQALAFKLWQQDGKLLAYQEGANAQRIQNLGIPGLGSVN